MPGIAHPLGTLREERARIATGFADELRDYRPAAPRERAGADLDDPGGLASVLPAAASAGREIMLLPVGGAGSLRMGAQLALNLRSLGLWQMLMLAPERSVCEELWVVLPDIACVWWPSRLRDARRPKPESLYNTLYQTRGVREFNPIALAIFAARKSLLEKLVLRHGLNVLHLDADSVPPLRY